MDRKILGLQVCIFCLILEECLILKNNNNNKHFAKDIFLEEKISLGAEEKKFKRRVTKKTLTKKALCCV